MLECQTSLCIFLPQVGRFAFLPRSPLLEAPAGTCPHRFRLLRFQVPSAVAKQRACFPGSGPRGRTLPVGFLLWRARRCPPLRPPTPTLGGAAASPAPGPRADRGPSGSAGLSPPRGSPFPGGDRVIFYFAAFSVVADAVHARRRQAHVRSVCSGTSELTSAPPSRRNHCRVSATCLLGALSPGVPVRRPPGSPSTCLLLPGSPVARVVLAGLTPSFW